MAWDDAAALLARTARLIAFTCDRAGGDNIWVMGRDGSKPTAGLEREVSPAQQPGLDAGRRVRRRGASTSPPRARWAPARCGSITASGGDGLQMTKKPNDQKDLGEPAFSPDGQYLYFSAGRHARRGVPVQQGLERPDLRDPATRSRDRRDEEVRHRTRRRRAAHSFARRQVARVRAPGARQDRAVREGARVRTRDGRCGTGSIATCRRRGRSTACTRRWRGRRTRSRIVVWARRQDLQRVDVASGRSRE